MKQGNRHPLHTEGEEDHRLIAMTVKALRSGMEEK
jgi:hypothetical protein